MCWIDPWAVDPLLIGSRQGCKRNFPNGRSSQIGKALHMLRLAGAMVASLAGRSIKIGEVHKRSSKSDWPARLAGPVTGQPAIVSTVIRLRWRIDLCLTGDIIIAQMLTLFKLVNSSYITHFNKHNLSTL